MHSLRANPISTSKERLYLEHTMVTWDTIWNRYSVADALSAPLQQQSRLTLKKPWTSWALSTAAAQKSRIISRCSMYRLSVTTSSHIASCCRHSRFSISCRDLLSVSVWLSRPTKRSCTANVLSGFRFLTLKLPGVCRSSNLAHRPRDCLLLNFKPGLPRGYHSAVFSSRIGCKISLEP